MYTVENKKYSKINMKVCLVLYKVFSGNEPGGIVETPRRFGKCYRCHLHLSQLLLKMATETVAEMSWRINNTTSLISREDFI